MCKGKKLNILGLNLTIHSQVYEPAEDTFLLLENLADYVKGERIIDVGCGCGIIGLYTLTVGAKEAILTDINPHAVENAKINAINNRMYERVSIIQCNLIDCIVPRRFNIIIFNPPYLPVEYNGKDLIELAWCGGKNGRRVIDEFIDKITNYKNVKLILMVQSSLSNVKKTISKFMKLGFKVKVIKRIHIFFEDIVLLEVKPHENK